MSVSLLEVLEHGGYDLSLLEDCEWLLSKKSEIEELLDDCEARIEQDNEIKENLND